MKEGTRGTGNRERTQTEERLYRVTTTSAGVHHGLALSIVNQAKKRQEELLNALTLVWAPAGVLRLRGCLLGNW